MDKIKNYPSPKEISTAIEDTFKQKPIQSSLKTAAIVALVALTILFGVLLGPLAPIPLVIGLTTIMLMNTAFLGWVLLMFDITQSLFDQFKKNHTIEKVRNKDVVLVLEAKLDHNDAFQMDQRTEFQKLEKKYAIAYEKVSNLEDIAESTNRVLMGNNRIKAIWLRAHGNPTGMTFSENSHLTVNNVSLLKHHFRQINPDGYFILDSCSTGGENPYGNENIAQEIASLVKGRTVIAPSRDTNVTSLMIGKENPFDMKFWVEKPPSSHPLLKYPSTVKNIISNIISFAAGRPRILKNFAYDATQVYHYGV